MSSLRRENRKIKIISSQNRATHHIMQGVGVDVDVNLINRGSPARRCFGDARMQGRPRVGVEAGNCHLTKPCAQHLLLSDVLLLLPTRFPPQRLPISRTYRSNCSLALLSTYLTILVKVNSRVAVQRGLFWRTTLSFPLSLSDRSPRGEWFMRSTPRHRHNDEPRLFHFTATVERHLHVLYY